MKPILTSSSPGRSRIRFPRRRRSRSDRHRSTRLAPASACDRPDPWPGFDRYGNPLEGNPWLPQPWPGFDIFGRPISAASQGALAVGEADATAGTPRWLRILIWMTSSLLILASLAAIVVDYELDAIVAELRAGAKRESVEASERELGTAPAYNLEDRLDRIMRQLDERPAGGAAVANRTSRPGARPISKAQTILIIGSDRRFGQYGGRSDTMILARIDPNSHTVSMLSIPRDLLVSIPGHGVQKINGAYSYGGPALLIATLRDHLGIRIDHYIEVTFRGFRRLVSKAGGLWIAVDQRYYVPPGAGHMAIDLYPGYQRLRPLEALAFARFRHYDSDFYRAARQQLVLREAGRELLKSRYDVFRLRTILRTLAEESESDIKSAAVFWRYLTTLRQTSPERIVRLTLPASGRLDPRGYYYLSDDTPTRIETLSAWLHPERKIRVQRESEGRLRRRIARDRRERARRGEAPSADSVERLLPDSEGERVVRALGHLPFSACALRRRPSGYFYYRDSSRLYRLSGQRHLALAVSLRAASGRSLLLMQTTWEKPPILDDPTASIRYRGRRFEVWYESGRIRQIAWRLGGDRETRAWLMNTLRNELDDQDMFELAASCRILR